jgi:hypothetical protein
VFSSWFEIQFLQLLPDLAHLIRLCFSASRGLQLQEAWSSLQDNVAAVCGARSVTKLRQESAEVVKQKVGIALASHDFIEQFFCLAHGDADSKDIAQR